LRLRNVKNLVRLESRPANLEGDYEVTIRDLIRNALRMRPDRIVVGEIRGEEALDMLQAMNTGNEGSLSTGHANSAKDMISRIETMVLMGKELPIQVVRKQIASAIDIFIHLSRMRDRTRKVTGIYEVAGMREGEVALDPLYEFRETEEKEDRVEGTLVRTGELQHTAKLLARNGRL
ncbi:MAG: CpaF family protein, partial [Lachnospiraceae bacterium]|nr:CpaF family protein [Lachnospiraceae bacterium]